MPDAIAEPIVTYIKKLFENPLPTDLLEAIMINSWIKIISAINNLTEELTNRKNEIKMKYTQNISGQPLFKDIINCFQQKLIEGSKRYTIFEVTKLFYEYKEDINNIIDQNIESLNLSQYVQSDTDIVHYCHRDVVGLYDTVTKKWNKIHLQEPINDCAESISVKKDIYITGGYKEKYMSFKDVRKIDNMYKSAKPMDSMMCGRAFHSLCYCEPYIYALGGLDEAKNASIVTCEKYDLIQENMREEEKKQECLWKKIGDLKKSRCYAASAMHKNTHIYMFCGAQVKDGIFNYYSDEIEQYDINKEKWNTLNIKCNTPKLTAVQAIAIGDESHFLLFGGASPIVGFVHIR